MLTEPRPALSRPKSYRALKPPGLKFLVSDLVNISPGKEMLRSEMQEERNVSDETMTTPLKSRLRPPDFRTSETELTTPARKVLPFNAYIIPHAISPVVGGPSAAAADSPNFKRLPAPKFDLSAKDRGKMGKVSELDMPVVEMVAEVEPVGEVLELQRGLLVSPEKGDRRRGRFVRYVFVLPSVPHFRQILMCELLEVASLNELSNFFDDPLRL
jgi:hypothetical protein